MPVFLKQITGLLQATDSTHVLPNASCKDEATKKSEAEYAAFKILLSSKNPKDLNSIPIFSISVIKKFQKLTKNIFLYLIF